MHVDLFVKYFIHVFRALSITSTINQCHHAFIVLFSFSFPLASWANLGPDSALTKAAMHNLGKEGSPSSLEMCIPSQH